MLEEVVQIRDAAPRRPKIRPRPEADPSAADFEALDPQQMDGGAEAADFGDPQETGYLDEYEDDYRAASTASMSSEAVKQEIIQSAMNEAGRILEDAVRQGEAQKAQLLGQAQQEVEMMKLQAQEEGRREGYAAVAGEVNEVAGRVEDAIATFEGERSGFEKEYEEELKWMALEIASKVLVKKVSEDDAEMLEMVDKAVQGLRNEAWIRVDVAQDMVHLIDRLSQLYGSESNIQVQPVPTEQGHVTIESPSGVVDASLHTQLQNLKEYFQKAAN